MSKAVKRTKDKGIAFEGGGEGLKLGGVWVVGSGDQVLDSALSYTLDVHTVESSRDFDVLKIWEA